ncbi:MAG: hypothetical protein J6A15_01395 [Clostridia bacterium]|nr:hypothetical protein [Clostridia bacterium]
MTENPLNDILQESIEDGSLEEIQEELKQLKLDNEALKSKNKTLEDKNQRLENGTSPSILDKYRASNANLREKNKQANEQIKKLKRRRGTHLAHYNKDELGVFSRMIDDFNGMERNIQITFPGVDHPIFTRFLELANKYPNRNFIIGELQKSIDHEKYLIDVEIKAQQNNIKTWYECDKIAVSNPDTWEDEVSDIESHLYKVTNPEDLQNKIDKLEKDKKAVDSWILLKDKITGAPVANNIEIKNNLYYAIMNEFSHIFNFCKNVGGVTSYKAHITVNGFNKDDMYSSLTRELERQVGLCEEPNTHTFYYSNGEGRLIPYELNRTFLKYINKNTTFVKYGGKKPQYRSGNIINSKVLFEDIPLYCYETQYRNPNLIGFNNCFYSILNGEIISLNPQAPILPLKNCCTELYLDNGDNEIEDNPMKEIFNTCFTEQDKRTILAYIGCALYDKGYTQRQESLYIMGKGGTGKTTLTKAICEIFYSVGHQLVTKLTEKNQFGFSMFTDSDVVVIDEIQAAKKDFADKIKEISGGGALPVEKKHYDTISVPAENVPRMFFIGNNFSKTFYEASDNAGVNRRILVVIPTQPIQDCNYQWQDLITDSSKQWLVQQATKEYIAQGLDNNAKKSITTISEEDKRNRIEMCTYPEQYFIKEHFEMAYTDSGAIDENEYVKYDDFHNFIIEQIDKHMLERTIKKGIAQTFIHAVKNAFDLSQNYNTHNIKGEIIFRGIIPKSTEAIEWFGGINNDLR